MAQPAQMQRTFTIRNDVNLKKNTLKLIPDESALAGVYHLEFTFDAAADCSIRVLYAATEKVGADGIPTFMPLKESGAHPKETRSKGLNQTFRTRESHPLDTRLYNGSDLMHANGRFPIIVCLEAVGGSGPGGEGKSAVQSQTTFASMGAADSSGQRVVTPIKQKIQVDKTSYELQEIYGIDGATASGGEGESTDGGGESAEGGDNARECVICMTEPRDTTVLPCRHMCMCSECAKVLRMQSEKCPICRTPIEQLLQIKISKDDEGGGRSSAAAAASTAA